RRGLRLLRAIAFRRGGDADARDDGPRAGARARPRRGGGGRTPLLHGHSGTGVVEARLREIPGGGPPGGGTHQPQALRVRRAPVRVARCRAARRRHPARAPQPGADPRDELVAERPVGGPPTGVEVSADAYERPPTGRVVTRSFGAPPPIAV